MRKFMALLSTAAMLTSAVTAGVTVTHYNAQETKAADTVVLANNGYPVQYYDDDERDSYYLEVKIESGTPSSIQWQQSTDGVTYENIEGETDKDFYFEPSENTYYRCVVDGNIISEPLQAISCDELDLDEYNRSWYFTNGYVAYCIDDDELDIVGKYTYTNEDNETEDVWLQTSYEGYWTLHSAADVENVKDDDYDDGNCDYEDLMICFDKDNPQSVIITVDLADDDTCLSFTTDTQIGDERYFGDYADDAALKAILNSDKSLKAITMVAVDGFANAKDDSGAFVIKTTYNKPSGFYIGDYDDVEVFDYNLIENGDIDMNNSLEEIFRRYITYYAWEESENDVINEINEDYSQEFTDFEDAILYYYNTKKSAGKENIKDLAIWYYNDFYEKEGDETQAKKWFFSKLLPEGVTEYNNKGDIYFATKIESEDSGLSIFWTDLTPGSKVSFSMAVGSYADTGAEDIVEEEAKREESKDKDYTSGGSTMTGTEIKDALDEDEVVIKEDSALDKAGITDMATAITMLDDEEKVTELVESALEAGNVEVVVVADEEKLAATLGTTDAAVISAVLNPVDIVKAFAGEDVIITLTVEKNNTAVSELGTVGEKIKALVTADEEAMFFDVDLTVQVGDSAPVVVSELGGTLNISVAIPESLRADGRTYGIILSHVDAEGNVTAEVVDNAVVENNVITYSVDKLCLMAITYKDSAAENNNNNENNNNSNNSNNENNNNSNNSNNENNNNSNKNEDVETGTSNWIWLGLFGPAMMAALVVLDLRRKKEEA